MRNKLIKTVICFFALLLLVGSILPTSAEVNTRAVDSAKSIIDGIIAYKTDSSLQDWIDGEITKKAGVSSEWYVVALSQYGNYDFGKYENALIKYLTENEVYSASSRQKYALALMAARSTDKYIYSTLNDSIGKLGVMSWIYGLHLLNNGYESADYTLGEVTAKLISLQTADGGWSVRSGYTEIDATAMAIQALAPYYKSENAVKTAVDKALAFLSAQQKDDGDYSSYGIRNVESTAQVLVALSSLGIDAKTDTRFIKNGNTLFDGIELYRLSNGSYCHEQGGAFSDNATVQVFYSMVSYLRMKNGQSPLYILDNAPAYKDLKIPETKPQPSDNTSSSTSSVASQAQKPTTSATPNSSSQTAVNTTGSDVSEGTVSVESIDAAESDTKTSAETQVNNEKDGKNQTVEAKKGINYKVWVCLAIVLVGGGVCVLLYFKKKGNKSNYILVAAVSAVAIAIVLFTKFQTADNYYSGTNSIKENAIGTVTISISCDDIPDKSAEHIPNDGVILDATEYQIEEGDTVYDILLEAVTDNKIHLDTSGEYDAVYVKGLNNIYEFEFGDTSGWIFHVNGEEPSISCGQYKLSPDDKIEWFYSCKSGNDLK